MRGGHVITTMPPGLEIQQVVVRRWDATTADSSGVVGYLQQANIALLSVAWAGNVPEDMTIADESPAPGVEVTVPGFGDNGTDVWLRVLPVDPTDDNSGAVFRLLCSKPDPRRRAGAVMCGADCVGVAIGSTFRGNLMGPTRDRWSLDVARPEVIQAAPIGDVIPWVAWRERRNRIQEAIELVDRAMQLFVDAKPDEAREALRNAIVNDRRCWRAWEALGESSYDSEEWSSTLNAAEHALELVPGEPTTSWMWAESLAKLGRHLEAIDAARRVVSSYPRESRGYLSLALSLSLAGRHDQALRAARRAVILSPTDDFAWRRLAEVERAASQQGVQ